MSKHFINTDRRPETERLAEIQRAAEMLVRRAVLTDTVVTISQRSLKPLAMGYYATMIDVRSRSPYEQVTAEQLEEMRAAAEMLTHRAATLHVVLTVWQESLKPLSMGNYVTRVAVRPARVLASSTRPA